MRRKQLFGREVLVIDRAAQRVEEGGSRGGAGGKTLSEVEFTIYPKVHGVGEGSAWDEIEGHWCIPWWIDGGSLHAELTLDDDEHRYGLSLGLGIGLFGLRWGRPRQEKRSREYGIRWHDQFVSLKLGAKPHEWSRDQPWWWENTLNLYKFLFGGHEYTETVLEEARGYIKMPEGRYPASVKITFDEWTAKRRWARGLRFRPFYKSVQRAEIEPDTPVPHPGKGENSYDQGEDAMFSLVTPAADVGDALQKAADSVMRSRIKYGSGYEWRPGEGA